MGFLDDLFAAQPMGSTSIGGGGHVCSNPVDATLDGLPTHGMTYCSDLGEWGSSYELGKKLIETGQADKIKNLPKY